MSKFLNYFSNSNQRTNKIKKNILASFLFKGLDILFGLMLLPLTLKYLGDTKFGIWQTIASVTSWFMFFDIGLGHGLRNKFAEAQALNKEKYIRNLVSAAYIFLILISVFMLLLFNVGSVFVNWKVFFNVANVTNHELMLMSQITFSLFSIYFVVRLIESIWMGDQKPALKDFFLATAKFLILIVLYLVSYSNSKSLMVVALIYKGIPVVLLFFASIYYFKYVYKNYIPSFSCFDFKYLRELGGLGLKFFIIQISVVILFLSGNIIIVQLYGPEIVTPYHILNKYFSLSIMGFSIIITPFWSAITDAFAKGEYDWIKASIKKLILVWGIFVLFSFFLFFFSDFIISIWLGETREFDFLLKVGWLVFALLQTLNMIFTFFLNGVGIIKVQLITSLLSIIFYVPLAIVLATFFQLGSAGVVFSINFFIAIYIIVRVYQYRLIIKQKATGIWAE